MATNISSKEQHLSGIMKNFQTFLHADSVTRIEYIYKLIIRFFCLGFAGCIFIFLYTIRPLIQIKIGFLQSERIGHLAVNTEYWLRRHYSIKREFHERNFFLTSGVNANKQLLKMIGRRVHVIDSNSITWSFRLLFKMFPSNSLWNDLSYTGNNDFDIWENIPPQLKLTSEENLRGGEFLKSIGMLPSQQFICFLARDKAYLDRSEILGTRNYWSYHDYRDCNIENYILAAQNMVEQGLWAFRMGGLVEKPISCDSSQIIDYAQLHRTDFNDIYLAANCKFYLGDTAGLLLVPVILNIPVALANIIPMGYLGYKKHDLIILKKLWHKGLKRYLTFREIFEIGADMWDSADKYNEADIQPVENSPEEILELAKEMNARLDGTWQFFKEDKDLQEKFWDTFPSSHPTGKCPSRIGAHFLRENKSLIE